MTWENRLIFEVSSADPDSATPVWIDLSSRILDVVQPIAAAVGRQNDLDQSEPGNLQLLLNNADDALSYGNTASPYPWWGPGRKCRLRDTVGSTSVPLLTGYLQVPTEGLVTAGIEQRVSVTAIDRLGRLDSSEPFISTLDAHITGVDQGTLKVYYPLTDAGGSNALTPLSQPALPLTSVAGFATTSALAGVQSAAAAGPPGDDARLPTWTVHLNASNSVDGALGFNAAVPYVRLTQPVVLSGTDKLALVMWANLADSLAVNDQLAAFFEGTLPALDIRRRNGVGGNWRMTMTFDLVNFLSLDHPANVATQRWTQIAARLSLSPDSQELWVDGVLAASAVGGPPPASATFDVMTIGVPWVGSLGYVQVYLLPASVDFAAFLSAQRQVGLNGLHRQSTGDRIRTIAQYAGIPSGEYASTVDSGSSVMQRATLAGQTPLAAMRDAERTEQGLLYVDGSGNLVFNDRRTLYNI